MNRLPRKTAFAILAAVVSATLLLAAVAFLARIPVHRSPIQIADAFDSGIERDFDAILLGGRQVGGTYVVTLTVAGVVQESGYNVGLLVQDLGGSYGTSVYELSYQLGQEKSYGIPTVRAGNSLTFRFPLKLLAENTYVVGLDAALFGTHTNDYVVEGPRENLRIERLLALPIDSSVFAVAAATLAILAIVGTTHAVDRVRRGGRGLG